MIFREIVSSKEPDGGQMTENAVLSCNTGNERKRRTRNFRDSGCLIVKYKNDFSCNRDSIDRNILATSKILQMTSL